MNVDSEFHKLSFHDATVDEVEREHGRLILHVSGALISSEHPASGGTKWHVSHGVLTLYGVTHEEARLWIDGKNWVPHPPPDHPVDEIMHATFDGALFAFDGFKENMPWHEWFVCAQRFQLSVLQAEPFSS